VREPAADRAGGLDLLGAFAWAALRYWLVVFPRASAELRRWRRSASRISDPGLRRLALASLAKRGNMEGAAAFATFVPWRQRASAIRALVAFQAIYNYADLLAEQPSHEPVANARELHRALLIALDPSGETDRLWGASLVHRRTAPRRGDGDYLAELIAACETASWHLPSYATVAASAGQAAGRIVAFQSLSLGSRDELRSWAEDEVPAGAGFAWWEWAAAAGSSLLVHALIAAAAAPDLTQRDVRAIEAAYFPCIGALHSLLDSLVDEEEDAATGQLRLLECYPSHARAGERLRQLATDALTAARELPGGTGHALLVIAMACSYLAEAQASSRTGALAREVGASLGPIARPALLVFKLRSFAAASRAATRRTQAPGRSPQAVAVDPETRGADARAV
jgi:tetraprenyl-beta-curcumene synthase